MTKEQVQLLRDAGISETAIIDRILQDGIQNPEPEAAPAPAPKPDPTPITPEPAPDNKQEQPVPDNSDKILAAIEKLTGAVLSHNVNGTGQEDQPAQSAEDILGNLLRNN